MSDLAYARRWFLDEPTFLAAVGAPETVTRSLLTAKAMPGAIYARSPTGDWWSALGAARGEMPPAPPAKGEYWYAPAAVWWGRRAILAVRSGASPEAAAEANLQAFVRDFHASLAVQRFADRAFSACFAQDGTIASQAAEAAAREEWSSWLSGVYAVCLRRFSAASCVEKESLARRLRDHFEVPGEALDESMVFDLIERLEGLMLPFAPSERPSCTPGHVVDRGLASLNLGAEFPYEGALTP